MKKITKPPHHVINAACLAATLFLIAAAAQAQDTINPLLPTPGTKELLVSGSLRTQPANDTRLTVGYGVFTTPRLQYGGLFEYSDAPAFRADYSLSATVNYHFPSLSPLLPFAGLSIGGAGGPGQSGLIYGAQGGLKYFLSSSTAFTATIQYRDYSRSERRDDFGTTLGFAWYF